MKVFELDLPGARAVFSTRQGGVSEPPYDTLNLGILTDDEREAVAENRRRLAERVGVEREHVAMGRQVHGADLQEWTEMQQVAWPPVAQRGARPPVALREVDGHVTDLDGVALLVLVADCLPVALAGGGRVAMVHCGWRGLAAGILERAVERFDEPPTAAIGPGIGRCCYEVGPEVLDAFGAAGPHLDLRAVAVGQLEGAGVTDVRHVELCTSCNPDLFFSHRRDDGVTGRQAGVVLRA
ncbi:MAG TPA: polyphenol oxidase family protein [Thermoleophilaceae bacterium]|nr:polyphenol oxidase family protein [Thermoleophilaceae bacterium]